MNIFAHSWHKYALKNYLITYFKTMHNGVHEFKNFMKLTKKQKNILDSMHLKWRNEEWMYLRLNEVCPEKVQLFHRTKPCLFRICISFRGRIFFTNRLCRTIENFWNIFWSTTITTNSLLFLGLFENAMAWK